MRIAIIGSHGLYANYGGWDQLVKNLAEKKDQSLEYLIFNSKETKPLIAPPKNVKVVKVALSASGFEGLFYDFWTILISYFKTDGMLLLGVQGMPLVGILSFFSKKKIIANVGGIEWLRPKFGFFSKLYLNFCFKISFLFSDHIILDNEHYINFVPPQKKQKAKVIPYGGEIDQSLNVSDDLISQYPFLNEDYFLSISRSLEDNCLADLCETFVGLNQKLVLISNFSASAYGQNVLSEFSSYQNIFLINGLYNKAELDLIRRKCKAYIHTHTLCGTAPSLVEMVIAQRPIVSINVPQNKFTLNGQGLYFDDFNQLRLLLESRIGFNSFIPSDKLIGNYDWNIIVQKYEYLYFN